MRIDFGKTILLAAALGFSAAPTSAEQFRRAADAYGNFVYRAPDGGPKIIRVGAAPRAASVQVVARPPRAPEVTHVVAAPNEGCESAVLLHGRSFVYGLDRGQTPVLGHPGCRY